jgi:hypothetical protein
MSTLKEARHHWSNDCILFMQDLKHRVESEVSGKYAKVLLQKSSAAGSRSQTALHVLTLV